ncbi:MAG: PQQ-binding-like beta-propeller repeat protein [Planctomycetota bacterium]
MSRRVLLSLGALGLAGLALTGGGPRPVWAQDGQPGNQPNKQPGKQTGRQPEQPAQPAPDRDLLLERSLPLRTALHHDPTLESPLERLVQLYREADRLEELIGVYKNHVAGYPRDLSARTVYVRLLLAAGEGEAEKELRRATALFPKDAYLAYLRFQVLSEDNDPRALDLLDRAIGLERRPVRKRAWIQRLLELAVAQDRRDLARAHLKAYAALLGGGSSAHLAAAHKMVGFGFDLEALEELAVAAKLQPSPENGVEIELLAANAEVALKRPDAAAKRLDALLGRLTADYWRRPEILRRRARLITSAAEREGLVQAARAAWKSERTPTRALDLARLLAGFDRHREALDVLLEASEALPDVRQLEQETLALFDRLRDERARIDYLAKRLAHDPSRQDLAEQRMRSLFLLGRNAEAQRALDALLAQLSERDRVKRLAEAARFLRAQSFPSFAAEVFEKAVALDPERLDLRRELAETLLASGEKGRAQAALRSPIPPKVDVALFLDLIQLMLREELYRDARVALLQQLEARPEHFELLLSLLEVEGRLGNGARGRQLVEQTRKLADNQARYRRWLEAAFGFYEYFWREDEFFTAERERFAADGAWDKRRAERLLAFADLCAAQQRAEDLGGLLKKLLERKDLPEGLGLELRRRMVAAPAFEPDELKAAIQNLELLAKEDPARKSEYVARLALARAGQERLDQARDLLAQVDAAALRDGDLLRSLAGLARQVGDGERSLALLERVTEVDAGDREAWERYVYALASTGDEARLRGALQQLLRAGAKLPLQPEVRRLLRAHLGDSAWRSVALLIDKKDEASLLEALALLDQVERTSDEGRAWVWVAWTRAHVLNLLDRRPARDAALAELERAFEHQKVTREQEAERAKREREERDPEAAKKAREKEQERLAKAAAAAQAGKRRKRGPATTPLPPGQFPGMPLPAAPQPQDEEGPPPTALPGVALVLPDGMCASPEAARRSLTAPARPARPTMGDRGGPLNPLALRWAYEAPQQAAIVSVQPLGSQRVLVSDEGGNVCALSRGTGKLEWLLPEAGVSAGNHQQQEVRSSGGSTWTTQFNEYWRAHRPVVAPDGTFYLPRPGAVSRYDQDGKLLAEVRLASEKELNQDPAPPLSVIVAGERTFLFEPVTGQAAALDRATSKLLWLTQLPTPRPAVRVGPDCSGAAFGDERLFVYGRWSAVLDARDGAVAWSFEPERVRRAAVRLTSEEADPLALLLPGLSNMALTPGAPLFNPGGGADEGPTLVDYTARNGRGWQQEGSNAQVRLVSPSVLWARAMGQNASRRGLVCGSRLVLAGEGSPMGNVARVIDLDLPMFARPLPGRGAFVGSYGDLLVLLRVGAIDVLDLSGARQPRTISLQGLLAKGRTPRLDACLDGPLVYVSGPKGVLCANAVTGARLFQEDWPAGATPKAGPKVDGYVDYGPRGILIADQRRYDVGQAYLDPVGLADGGQLFVPAEPWRLVALGTGEGAPLPPKDDKDGDGGDKDGDK